MSAPGKKPITFKKGALKRQLGVPAGKPIPAKKIAAAKTKIAKAKKVAAAKDTKLPAPIRQLSKRIAFMKGVLKTGRMTAARNRRRRT
ncbi:MAG: hypothetical protein ACFFDN_00755 [Candidatus Hodarchaeota archaeon]